MGTPVGYGSLVRGRRGTTNMCCGFQGDTVGGCIITVYYSPTYYTVLP